MRSIATLAAVGGALAIALGFASAASADSAPVINPAASLSGDYSYVDANTGGEHINEYGAAVSGVAPLWSTGLGVQGDASYHNLSANNGGGSVNSWTAGGSAFYRGSLGRVGATVNYDGWSGTSGLGGGDLNFVSYGAFMEWYANDYLTLGVKGGGVSDVDACHHCGSAFNGTLGYVGGLGSVYPIHDLALSGSIDWIGDNAGNITNYNVRAEYLVSREFPVSVFAGYDYTSLTSHVNLNTFNVGVKFYFGAPSGSLLDLHRDGLDDWGTAPTALRVIGG